MQWWAFSLRYAARSHVVRRGVDAGLPTVDSNSQFRYVATARRAYGFKGVLKMSGMTIGRLAQDAGVHLETVCYYENASA